MNINKFQALWAIFFITIVTASLFLYNHIKKKTNYNKLISEVNHVSDNDIVFGNEQIKHSIIIYFDYNCGYCQKFFKNTYPELERFISNGEINLVLRLVCNKTDKAALDAYQTAICINKLGSFKNLHKLLLYEGRIIYTEHFRQLIDEYIHTNSDIAECIVNENNNAIKHNINQFQELNIKGTPTFIIGKKVLVGYRNIENIIETLETEFNLKLQK